MTRFRSFLRSFSALALAVATTLTLVMASAPASTASTDSTASAPAPGYWVIGQYGGVWNFGAATPLGSIAVSAPLVAAASTPSGRGLWLADSNGRIYTLGDAVFHGDLSGLHLNKPVVGMSATKDGGGYWMVAGDGGIFTFGDAVFHGSLGSYKLNKPVVAMATTPDGGGYWMVASDGGIFTFGTARFFGSEGSVHLNQPVIGMSPTADGQGYWLVATDGGVFTHGDAPFAGSLGSYKLNKPITSMTPTSDNGGYWLIGADGGVFTFGDAPFVGSLGSNPPSQKVVFLAPLPPGSASQPAPTPVQSPPPPPPGPAPISTVSAPSISAEVGQTWTGTVAMFQDSNGAAVQGQPLINWGDGHTSYGTVSGSGGSWTVSCNSPCGHAWANGGTYTVTVNIADTAGATGSASGPAHIIGHITAAAHAASISWSNNLFEGTQVPGTTVLGIFTDNNTNVGAAQLSATIDWHDVDAPTPDVMSTGTVVAIPPSGQCPTSAPCYEVQAQNPTSTPTASHCDPAGNSTYTYCDEGQYHPTVTVSENGSAPVSISQAAGSTNYTNTIDIGEGDASFTPGTPSFTEGTLSANQILATFTDTGSLHDQGDNTNPAARNGHPNSPFSFSVDWGDGSTPCVYTWTNPPAQFSPNCSLIGLASSGMSIYGNHQYTSEGTYTVTVTLAEFGYTGPCIPALGNSSTCTISYQVTVGDSDSYGVTSGLTVTQPGGAGAAAQASVTFSDSNLATVAGDLTATINWGNGTTTNGTVTGSNGSFTVTGSNTYNPADVGVQQNVTVTISEGPSTNTGSASTTYTPI